MEYAYFANHNLLSERIIHKNFIGTPDIPILTAESEIEGI